MSKHRYFSLCVCCEGFNKTFFFSFKSWHRTVVKHLEERGGKMNRVENNNKILYYCIPVLLFLYPDCLFFVPIAFYMFQLTSVCPGCFCCLFLNSDCLLFVPIALCLSRLPFVCPDFLLFMWTAFCISRLPFVCPDCLLHVLIAFYLCRVPFVCSDWLLFVPIAFCMFL